MSRAADTPPSPPPPAKAGTDRLIALFLFALVAFNPPLLRVFGAGDTLFGLPLLYVYVLGVWAAVIALSARLLERGGRG
ncbi:hypothetical protein [Azospirillum rugosum]|uniref:DUF3311 domain-containing protein n=1 Tax=Azospirillum rugosum TaxID=416170 RepID=A0ABS4SKS3_9PROT|nr:hypothetical protein [Azospirillum rugosum]MBP2293158.1 hypothetical protein [Azospirillum rugosum]MDQ0526707.1 hypothetical protein [Azospirillum rugosum]